MHGAPINAETNTAMPAGFLMHQIELREALDEAQTISDFEQLRSQTTLSKRNQLSKVEQLIDVDKDYKAAAQEVRGLMFMERFASEIEERIELLEQ
jgi:molecular chaperone HscB